jgi:hypothetical protein
MSQAIKALPRDSGQARQPKAPKRALVPVDLEAVWPEADAGPANHLQLRLSKAYAEPRPRWSARRTLAFVVLTCGGFWLAVGLGVRALLH